MVLVALDRILVAVLELLLIEVERGCKLLELRVFNYLEALLLFVGVYILAEGFIIDRVLFKHVNITFLVGALGKTTSASKLRDGRHREEIHEVGLL